MTSEKYDLIILANLLHKISITTVAEQLTYGRECYARKYSAELIVPRQSTEPWMKYLRLSLQELG